MAQKSSVEGDSLPYTPTWAVAAACSVFILSSLLVERTVFSIGYVFKKYKQIALEEAFEKIKEELMLVGFISLALTLGQNQFSKICVPTNWTNVMLTCTKTAAAETIKLQLSPIKRQLASGTTPTCKEGQAPFISLNVLHQLHTLLFALAVVHVLYSFITVALGTWKVHNWKAWEQRVKPKEELSDHGVRLARETTFVQKRVRGIWSTNSFLAYVAAFFQQFYNSVSETDYHTLRHGFIQNHMPRNIAFDFHKYMLRSLQEDFKYVVGISPGLWGYTVLLMLLNIDGWEMHLWASLLPLLLVLVIGTKLQRIITKMAVQIVQKQAMVAGIPDVQPSDALFWFKRPRLILSCIHFILFQNAFEMSIIIWSEFNVRDDKCLHKNRYLLILRLVIGIFAQMICGYVTLPIYALVSQMGSNIKRTVFEDHIQLAIKRWHREARSHHDEHQSSSSAAADHLEAQNTAIITATTTHADHLEAQNTTTIITATTAHNEVAKVQRQMSYLERVSSGGKMKGPVYHTLPGVIESSSSAAADHLEAQNTHADSNDDTTHNEVAKVQRQMSYLERVSSGGEMKAP